MSCVWIVYNYVAVNGFGERSRHGWYSENSLTTSFEYSSITVPDQLWEILTICSVVWLFCYVHSMQLLQTWAYTRRQYNVKFGIISWEWSSLYYNTRRWIRLRKKNETPMHNKWLNGQTPMKTSTCIPIFPIHVGWPCCVHTLTTIKCIHSIYKTYTHNRCLAICTVVSTMVVLYCFLWTIEHLFRLISQMTHFVVQAVFMPYMGYSKIGTQCYCIYL